MYYYIVMKAIQVTIDESLLETVDRFLQKRGENRSAFIRDSLEHYIKTLQTLQKEEKHRLAYQKHSNQKNEFEIWHKEQSWGNL